MAPWMGYQNRNWERAQWTYCLPRLYQILLWLSKVENQMRAWAFFVGRQNQETLRSIICKTYADHHDNFNVQRVHWSTSLESIPRANFEHIWNTNRTKQCYRKLIYWIWSIHLAMNTVCIFEFLDFVRSNDTSRNNILHHSRQVHEQAISLYDEHGSCGHL